MMCADLHPIYDSYVLPFSLSNTGLVFDIMTICSDRKEP